MSYNTGDLRFLYTDIAGAVIVSTAPESSLRIAATRHSTAMDSLPSPKPCYFVLETWWVGKHPDQVEH